MQPLSWWVQCLLLRTLPVPLLRQEQQRLRRSSSSGEEENMGTVPLRAPAGHPHQVCVFPGSVKACRSGAFCLLGALAVAVLLVTVNILFRFWPGTFHEELFQRMYMEGIDNNSISCHLKYLVKEPHIAGSPENFATAQYVESTFKTYGLDAHHKDYNVLLTYPLHRSLILTTSSDQSPLTLSLKEEAVPGDPYSNNSKVVPTFHGYAPSGNTSGEVVYANYGREEDFQQLSKVGVAVKDAIVIARYGLIFRGDIVENAAKAGAVAVVIYSDPLDYGHNGTEGYYPDSQWLPPSGVQRGSVFRGVGDPLTPGWPSETHSERLSVSDPEAQMPRIPSLPISAEDALPILKSLGGPAAPAEWCGALDLPEYKLGRGPGRLNLSYVANQTVTPIRNVFATIAGSHEPDRIVLLGNHRDAWVFGAVDPNSGTASLLELARGLGKLWQQGWRPRRTIVLCSWDAEEYGLVGSTEWVEQNIDILGTNAVAYLNVDCAVAGPGFYAASSPQLDDLLMETTKKVADPECVKQSLYESWVASSKKPLPSIDRLGGGGSDYASFLQHAGVPSMDLFFGDADADYPTYHSVYDNYNWMSKFGDPLFHRHVAMTRLWGLLAMRLADDAVLPLNYETYANELESYANSIHKRLTSVKPPNDISIQPLLTSIDDLRHSSNQLADELKAMTEGIQGQAVRKLYQLRGLNDRLLHAERGFLDCDGIVGSSWYKHLVYGPVSNNGYGSLSFPGIWDAIYAAQTSTGDKASNAKKWAAVQHEIYRGARVTTRASLVLKGKLT